MRIKHKIVKRGIRNPEKETVYIDVKNKRMYFICFSNHCDRKVTLNMKGSGEIWSVNIKGLWNKRLSGPINIHPSIWSVSHPNKCHYWIQDGKIIKAQ